jgi:quercetin dioxygenase-like cupin family protein
MRWCARSISRGCATLALPYPAELGGDEGAAMRVFFFESGRTDPPHVHFNSVTTHLVLEGRFQVRHWDRVREQAADAPGGAGFVLRETHDRTIGPGESTSISEPRDNGHWHQCLARGVLLDIEQGRLDPSIRPRRRQMIDLSAATREGEFLAPAITNGLALRRYG